jgi:hypothetical protein
VLPPFMPPLSTFLLGRSPPRDISMCATPWRTMIAWHERAPLFHPSNHQSGPPFCPCYFSLSLSLSLSVSPVLTLLAWRACAPRRHAVHHRETERASSPLPRQFTSTKPQPPSSPTPLCPGGGVAIRIKRPIHGGRSISFLVATGEIC